MNAIITAIQSLIEANEKITVNRTPFLDVSLGGLRTALHNATEHVNELARRAEAASAAVAADTAPAAAAETSSTPAAQ